MFAEKQNIKDAEDAQDREGWVNEQVDKNSAQNLVGTLLRYDSALMRKQRANKASVEQEDLLNTVNRVMEYASR